MDAVKMTVDNMSDLLLLCLQDNKKMKRSLEEEQSSELGRIWKRL
jgi:hypothetical protein